MKDATIALEWYRTKTNNGRGKLTAEAKALLSAGFVSIKHTSAYCWTLTITKKGLELFNEKTNATGN